VSAAAASWPADQQRRPETPCVPCVFIKGSRGTTAMLDLARRRRQMIDLQVAGRGITNPLVLEAMRRVPRERFVSEGLQEFAYEDSQLPIEVGQTISQPYIVAAMIEAAAVQ